VGRLLKAHHQSHAALTVEIFGWIILIAGTILLLAPYAAAAVLFLPVLAEQAADYVRLAGLLVSGLGMLYVVSGRSLLGALPLPSHPQGWDNAGGGQ
jgi:hypothetical protein